MFTLSIKAETDKFAAALSAVATKQLPYALSRALNDTAQDVLTDNKRLMESVFDRPTPYTLGAFMVRNAKPDALQSTVEQKSQASTRNYLRTEEQGGARKQTGLDKLLSMRIAYAGHLWGVIPGDGAKLDRYGNWSSGERNQVLAILKAMRDGSANETSRSRKRAGGKRAQYFVSPPQFKTPGVWKRVPGLKQPQLVLLFVASAPGYQSRLPFHDNAERVARERFPINFANRFNSALASAR
ncbi:MAG: hypothetical protein ACOH2H_16135 [Cypionkella sp.]